MQGHDIALLAAVGSEFGRIDREDVISVLEQYDSFVSHLSSRSAMLIGAEVAEALAFSHRSAENESEDIAAFVVELFRSIFALFDEVIIRLREVVGVVGIG